MSDVLAYFLTWRTYGTWLHGDDRASVDDHHNQLYTPLIAPDPARIERITSAMRDDPCYLCPDARSTVEQTIRRHCKIRAWSLHAINPRTTHVHVIVNCHTRASPETAMEQFKAWCTRHLRQAGFAAPDQKVWADHGSTRWIDTPESLAEAIDYVNNQQ